MKLNKTTFPDSAIFTEKKRIENRLWAKKWIFVGKKNAPSHETRVRIHVSDFVSSQEKQNPP